MQLIPKHTVLFALAAILAVGCLKEDPAVDVTAGEGLRLRAGVLALDTKADVPGEEDRNENNLGTTLDVYIQGVTDASFWKEYHISQGNSYVSGEEELLSVNWKRDGFKAGDLYDVYVVANATSHANAGNYGTLSTRSQTDTDIPTLKRIPGDNWNSSDAARFPYKDNKVFLMDGFVKNWSPVASESKQVIDVPNMERAAAKIVVNLQLDPAYLTSIRTANGGAEPLGEPMFKYVNFATATPVIRAGSLANTAPETAGGFKRLPGYDPVNHQYGITTYSYACTWGSSNLEVGLEAPYVLISFFVYSIDPNTGASVTTRNYYRIPVRPAAETSLERNHIYTVNATIDSPGSTSVVDAKQPVNLSYQVLDWTRENTEITNVIAEKYHYFIVSPLEYVLRGEGTQSVSLPYYAPEGAAISIGSIPTATLTSDGATEPTVSDQAFYLDKNGDPQTSSATVNVNTTNKTIEVSSDVLANRAVKYIRFRATYTYDDNGTEKYIHQDVYIRHFPVDNIQNIAGWYSYKIGVEYSFNPAEDGWTTWDGYEDNVIVPDAASYDKAIPEYRSDETRVLRGTANAYFRDIATNQTEFQAALTDSDDRRNANGFNNAIQGSGNYSDSYYYGLNPSTGFSRIFSADYWVTIIPYKYNNYQKVTYYTATARRYYRYVDDAWVRWMPDSQTAVTPSISGKTVDEGTGLYFRARVYNSADKKIYYIGKNTTTNKAVLGTSTGQTNNHMYVVQISSTSDSYVIGRPVIAANNESLDRTVSPAFMLASQLGSTYPVTDARKERETPATHCARYVEAGLDGTVYTGWRLPTKDEIDIINQYQSRDGALKVEIDKIFTGHYYSSLDGGNHTIEGHSGQDNEYIRCVRDLTPEELAELNKVK